MALYFEMYSGIAGDMTIGALLDLGARKKVLIDGIDSLNLPIAQLSFRQTIKNTIAAYDFDTRTHVEKARTMEALSLEKVHEILEAGNFSEKVKEDSRNLFTIAAKAEASSQGMEVKDFRFHPVGVVDSFIDFVGTSLLIEDLAPDNIYFSDLYEAKGYQMRKRGPMPLPEPAVLSLIKEYGLPLQLVDDEGERNTLTGACIVAYYRKDPLPERFLVRDVGIGAGNSDFKKSTNVLRVYDIEVL
ncbi:MAG: DUF111 family protein [Tissierellia bacterium]|nr:DUF111 family protein [Tissierellia bacterium]